MIKKESEQSMETDGQLIIRIAKKFIILFFVILMFDSILDLLSTLLDFILEVLHLIIEFFEYSLELLLKHIINSNHYESDIIIVNVAILIGIYIFFRLLLKVPRVWRWITRRIKASWLRYQRKNTSYWHSISLARKVETITTYSIGILCILFLVTL